MSADSEQRKLAAIMFTDMVGYSALAQSDDKLALELLEEHRELLRAIFPRFNGAEIKTIGDGFLVEFNSALEAAQCAIEIQRALSKHHLALKRDSNALRLARQAASLLPPEKDAILGNFILTGLAQIEARTGGATDAVAILRRQLADTVGHVSIAHLKSIPSGTQSATILGFNNCSR